MATISILCSTNQLVPLGGGLDPREQSARLIYALSHVINWLENELENIASLEAGSNDGRQTAIEQVDFLLHEFISGADLSFYRRSHFMKPFDCGV